jgi:hypothetical protein
LQIYNFGQQSLNSSNNGSAAKDSQVLLHFQQIVSGVLTPLCPMEAVIYFLCGWSAGWSSVLGHWLLVVGCWLLVVGLWLLVVSHWLSIVGHQLSVGHK